MLLYFRGCTAREKLNSISKATERILRHAKISYETLEDEKCCGSVLLRTGFLEDAIEHMNGNLEDFEGRTILTSCAGCYKTLKEDYKKYLGVDLKVIHISQLLEQLIRENKISLKGNNDLNVTYHDSCHLGRHAGEYDAPRNVINSISNLVEMENTKEKARCCGSGGGVKSAYGELSNSIADLRIQEARQTDADLLVTACPFCKLNLSQNSQDLDVLDLSEFVLKHLDLTEDCDKEGEIQ
ncbi:(Fe-S)-binding protein [Methanobrevibacter sp.]|uniref:(Fe-S)-binding protein n=1 Tax=Methanobrevibacter sp. TaxID=66852 RepID=UPI0025E8E981|nr:(Fe-S)-binding protein [Methanobrevibacter sp.]MBQ2962183.1 (Fe-S)-binding protein [Methanobrevibacter sp.]